MYTPLNQIQTFEYIDLTGQKHPVLFVLDPKKKGYINATAIAKQFGKEPKDWLKNQNICDYITALIDKMNSRLGNYSVNSDYYSNPLNLFQEENSPLGTKTISYDDLVISIHGGTPGQNGTWLHPKLAVIFSRWMSAHFAVWCDEQIEALLHQHPEHQKQFPELSAIFERLEKNQQQLKHEINHRLSVVEQHVAENINTTAQMLNHWQAQSAQDNKHALGQIFNSINQLNKVLNRQQQADLFKPPVEVTIKQILLDYQHSLEQMLQQMLHGQQDDLIQNYLLAIKDNLERIVQRLATESAPTIQPVTHGSTNSPPVTQPAIATTELATEIAALKAQGWSWQRIAQELNARGTVTTSGKGQWHGSSVKRYLESHAAG